MTSILRHLRIHATKLQSKHTLELCSRNRRSLSKRLLECGFSSNGRKNDSEDKLEAEVKQPKDSLYNRVKAAKKKTSFSIDRSTLIGGWQDGDVAEENNNEDKGEERKGNPKRIVPPMTHKEQLTPLAKDLQYYIKMRGPITLHDYVGQTSNHSLHGYYQQKVSQPVIGEAGDFITSPEISQLFGEMIGIWLISAWKSLGSPSKFRLVECSWDWVKKFLVQTIFLFVTI